MPSNSRGSGLKLIILRKMITSKAVFPSVLLKNKQKKKVAKNLDETSSFRVKRICISCNDHRMSSGAENQFTVWIDYKHGKFSI